MPVTVSDVKFNNSVGQYSWNNVVVKLSANENIDKEALNPKYVDNIGVRITLGYNVGTRKENNYYFLRSEVTIATMEIGQDKTFAFWIPEDIVDRGNLGNEPEFWVIELSLDGRTMQLQPENMCSRFNRSGATPETFLNNASSNVSKTEGILVPYYLSPYGPVDRSPPAFIRKEPK
jgi:hypothetical protein